jgi:squalene-associated FAD-dependent desaturase
VKKKVVVVGGGWAGLSAALALVERGVEVQLFEKRAILGGRAYSYRAREAGHTVDNGQHLLMGCYRATLRFLDRIGARDRVEIQPRLSVPFLHPERGSATFRCALAPSPFHLVLGAMGYTHLTPRERWRLVSGGLRIALRYRGGSEDTVSQALHEAGQSENLRVSFWNPLAIAMLNDLPERASADLFAEVLRRVFFARPAASCIVFPRVGLSDLFAEPAAAAIERLGGAVETGPAVRSVVPTGERASGVAIEGRGELRADAVILAVPPPALGPILPEGVRSTPRLAAIDRLQGSPIVSVHFWFEEAFETPRMAGFLDGPIHWLFTPPMQPERGRYVTLVVSGAHALVTRRPEEIAQIARRELERYVPRARALHVADSLVVKEPQATYAATPEEQSLRPGPSTPIANLFLAGDWTDTGLPATLESAVVSGERAAEAAAAYLGTL